ncbi:hypothetical protein QL285_059430 [Trifolium repens]|nr:hypothetical protein QL285_059430 [Trifolium repens]
MQTNFETLFNPKLTRRFPLSTTDVRGANTFPLRNRLSNPEMVAMTTFPLLSRFYRYFPFPTGMNKVRWRLCVISSVHYARGLFPISSYGNQREKRTHRVHDSLTRK